MLSDLLIHNVSKLTLYNFKYNIEIIYSLIKIKLFIDPAKVMMLGQEPRQTTSNLGHLHKPSIQALIHGLNRHYYSIAINYRKVFF